MTITVENSTYNKSKSVIFPTAPAKLNIHHVPNKAEFFSYNTSEGLTLSAWMPSGFANVTQTANQTYDQFYESNCSECSRNCMSWVNRYRDEDGNLPDYEPELDNHCWVYDEGYSGQHCPEGYEMEELNVDFPISNMVFQIGLSAFNKNEHGVPILTKISDSAYLSAGKVHPVTKQITSTEIYMAANVFGDVDYNEGICWGYNSPPNTLAGVVSSYLSTPFNNDLTNISTFRDNCERVEYLKHNNRNFLVEDDETYLCSGGADALLLLDVENDIQAFFTFLIAGFKSLENLPHIMMVPVNRTEYEMDGSTYSGYKTYPDAVGKSWFITMDGYLLGQM